MRAVGVHLDDDVVAVLERPVEAGEVGGAEALLALAVQHVDVVVGGGEPSAIAAGAVGAVVVGDEDVGLGDGGAEPRR